MTRQRIITKQDKVIAELRAKLRALEARLGVTAPTFDGDSSCSQ